MDMHVFKKRPHTAANTAAHSSSSKNHLQQKKNWLIQKNSIDQYSLNQEF